jgi:hypothetical protein
MTATPAEIARGLSEEQRQVLRRCADHERLMGGFYGLAWTNPPLVEPVGIHHPIFGSHYQLNALGLQVRELLQKGA